MMIKSEGLQKLHSLIDRYGDNILKELDFSIEREKRHGEETGLLVTMVT